MPLILKYHQGPIEELRSYSQAIHTIDSSAEKKFYSATQELKIILPSESKMPEASIEVSQFITKYDQKPPITKEIEAYLEEAKQIKLQMIRQSLLRI